MAITFPKAPRVSPGDKLTAAQMIALANAFNARERSGLGDYHWRSVKYEANAFLQVRNSDEFGNMPPMGEFFWLYQLLDGENDPGEWPAMGPGEPEGANVVSPFCAFTFGVELAGYPGEEGRISDPAFPLWLGFNPPATNEEFWTLGKYQRGAIDFQTGEQNAPAIECARSAQYLNYGNLMTPYGKGHGGFFPTPNELSPSCGSDESTGIDIPSFEIFFTALAAGVPTSGYHGTLSTNGEGKAVVTYSGSCPYWTEFPAPGHVQAIVRFPDAYFVAVLNGSMQVVWDVFPTETWIEGPYTNDGTLSRYDGQHIARGVWAFVNDFRGTPAQRNPDDFDIEKIAFSFQEYHSRQNLLSPNRGAGGAFGLSPIYPFCKSTPAEKVKKGSLFTFTTPIRGTSYAYHSGYVLAGMFAKATGLAAPVLLHVKDGPTILQTISLSPDAPTALHYLPNAVTPKKLLVEFATEGAFTDASGQIVLEFTEQLAHKPNYWDAYLLLRQSATKGGFSFEGSFLDGSGTDQEAATAFYKNYLTFGVIYNPTAAGIRSIDAAISSNPVYDAARRQSREMMRMARHQELISYEVLGGKSILRFNRYAYGKHNTKADIFHGIAPSYKPAAKVQEGIEYVVRSHTGGTVTYAGRVYPHNARFKGFAGITKFSASGDGQIFEYEGIRPDAPKNGWSNEWLMSMDTRVYHPSPSSLWKEDAYGDWYLFNDRCLFYAYNMPPQLHRVADLPADEVGSATSALHLSPESPPGYRYLLGMNAPSGLAPLGYNDHAKFCSSCQVYTQPYELESATVEFVPGGADIVRLVLKTRLRSHPDAQPSLDRDALDWNHSNIYAEDYRTDDNAVCMYMMKKYVGLDGPATWKLGDSAFVSFVTGLPDNPFGSILPRFYFTSLVKKPCASGAYDDRSRITIEELRKCERKLKAWCEGTIDGMTTKAHFCGGGQSAYDYTFENLCRDAFSGREIADFVGGFGPQVNTEFKASIFNKLASCVDLLNRFRIDGLMQFQHRELNYYGATDKFADYGNGVCPPGPNTVWYFQGCPPGASLYDTGAWGGSSGFTAWASASGGLCGPSGQPLSLTFSQQRKDIEYRYLATPGFENAIPNHVQDLIDSNSTGVFGTAVRVWITQSIGHSLNPNDGSCIVPGQFVDGSGGYYTFPQDYREEPQGCIELSNGFVAGGQAPCGIFAGCSHTDPTAGAGWQELGKAGSSQSYTFTKLGGEGFAMIVVPVV